MSVPASELEGALRKSPFFSAFAAPQLRAIAQRGESIVRPAGSVIWREGEAVEAIALVVSGRCKVRRQTPRSETILDVVVAGDVVGTLGWTMGQRYQSDLVTLRKTRLFTIPATFLNTLLQRDASVTAALALSLGEHVLRLYRHIEDLGAGSVESRVARLLLRLSDRAGEPFPGGTLVPVTLRRRELASMAATTLESISRTLNKLEREGVIRLQPIGFVVRDAAALKKRCG